MNFAIGSIMSLYKIRLLSYIKQKNLYEIHLKLHNVNAIMSAISFIFGKEIVNLFLQITIKMYEKDNHHNFSYAIHTDEI